jgi:hypothetical protein
MFIASLQLSWWKSNNNIGLEKKPPFCEENWSKQPKLSSEKKFGFESKHIQHRNISLEKNPANFIAEKWVKIA